MKILLKLVVASLVAIAGLVGLLLFLAWRAGPVPTLEQALASLPEGERAALTRICAAAKVPIDGKDPRMRLIFDASGHLFADGRNAHAVVIEGGHVLGLSLNDVRLPEATDWSGLPALRALSLRSAGLARWPDLRPLASLEFLDLGANELGEGAPTLPAGLRELHLGRTTIADLTPLAALSALVELDVSYSKVEDLTPLLGLALQSVDLRGTPIRRLPERVPTAGDWRLDLDGTAIVQPEGYAAEWPFDGWIAGTARDGDHTEGRIDATAVAVRGNLAPLERPLAVHLPHSDTGDRAHVALEVSVSRGTARVWLEEPPELFASPWFAAGKVKGFGALRGRGYVFVDVRPDRPARLVGTLRTGSIDRSYERSADQRRSGPAPRPWTDYSFFVEPREGGRVEGLRYVVTPPRRAALAPRSGARSSRAADQGPPYGARRAALAPRSGARSSRAADQGPPYGARRAALAPRTGA